MRSVVGCVNAGAAPSRARQTNATRTRRGCIWVRLIGAVTAGTSLFPASPPRYHFSGQFVRPFDSILYIARTGCQWRMLPKDFPPFSTVQGATAPTAWTGGLDMSF